MTENPTVTLAEIIKLEMLFAFASQREEVEFRDGFFCNLIFYVADQVRKEITRHKEGEFSIQFSSHNQVRTTKWLRMDTGVTANPVSFILARSCSYGYDLRHTNVPCSDVKFNNVHFVI